VTGHFEFQIFSHMGFVSRVSWIFRACIVREEIVLRTLFVAALIENGKVSGTVGGR